MATQTVKVYTSNVGWLVQTLQQTDVPTVVIEQHEDGKRAKVQIGNKKPLVLDIVFDIGSVQAADYYDSYEPGNMSG